MLGVDDDDVGTVAHPEMAGVDAIPVGQFTGEPVHGVLDGHERVTGALGVANVTQQSQPML